LIDLGRIMLAIKYDSTRMAVEIEKAGTHIEKLTDMIPSATPIKNANVEQELAINNNNKNEYKNDDTNEQKKWNNLPT
jgi:uncharacterized spore protein YtfJ